MSTTTSPSLTRDALRAAARDAAEDHGTWCHRLPRERDRRGALLLHRDETVEIWALSWSAGHDTGFHDHGGSSAAIAVVTGVLREERLALGPPAVRVLAAGQVVDAHPEHVHRIVKDDDGAPAVSVHAYSPPLREVGEYRVAEGGLIERTPLPGDHDLGDGDVLTGS